MSGIFRSARVLSVCGLALVVATVAWVIDRSAERGRFATAHSSYGAGPAGTRGLFELTRRLGFSPVRWAEDLSALPADGLLLAFGGCSADQARPLSRYEQGALSDWVMRGGHLIVAGARGYLPDVFGVRFAFEPDCAASVETGRVWYRGKPLDAERWPEPEPAEPQPELAEPATEPVEPKPAEPATELAQPKPVQADAELAERDGGAPARSARVGGSDGRDPPADPAAHGVFAVETADTTGVRAVPEHGQWLAGLGALPMDHAGTILLDPDLEHFVLARAQAQGGTPMAVLVPHGRGHLVVLASASPFHNASLARDDGGVAFFRLLHFLAPSGPVLFDEYHLGIGQRRSAMRYLRGRGASPLLVVIGLVLLGALWRSAVRFGPLSHPATPSPTVATSFARALGGLYARSGDRAGAVASLAEHAYHRIAHHHHLGPLAGAALARALRERGLEAEAAAVSEIGAVVAAPPTTLVIACERLDRALREAGVGARLRTKRGLPTDGPDSGSVAADAPLGIG